MKTILIAEDSPDQAKILIALFKSSGYQVTHVTNGLSAYDEIKSKRFDLLITDIMMPVMSGFELLGRIKEESLSLATIVLTSRGREEDILKSLQAGAMDYLAKPFSPSDLLMKVKKILQ